MAAHLGLPELSDDAGERLLGPQVRARVEVVRPVARDPLDRSACLGCVHMALLGQRDARVGHVHVRGRVDVAQAFAVPHQQDPLVGEGAVM